MEILGFLRVIRERIWLVVLTTSACLLVVIVYQILPPSSWEAQGSLQVNEGASLVTVLEADKVNILNYQLFWETVMQLGESRKLVRQAAATIGITGPDIVKNLQSFQLTRETRGNVVTFTGTGDTRNEALKLTQAGMKGLIDNWRASRVAAAQQAAQVLTEHLAKANAAVNTAQEALNKFQQPSLPGTPQEQLLSIQQEIVAIQSQLVQAKVEASISDDRATAVRQMAQQELAKSAGERTPAAGSEAAALESQKATLSMQLALMLQTRKPDHPDVKALKAQIAEIDKMLKNQPNPTNLPEPFETQEVSAQLDARSAAGKAAAYDARLRELQASLPALAQRAKDYQDAANRADQAQTYRDGLLDQIRTANAEAARLKAGADITILDQPELLPSPKTIKKFLLFLFAAIVMGILLGAFTAVFMRYVDVTVRDELDVSQMLGKPVLAVIPRFEEVAPVPEEPAPPESPTDEEQQDES